MKLATRWLLGVLMLALWPTAAHAQSQEWTHAYERAYELWDSASYEEGIPFARQALELAESEFGPDHVMVAHSLSRLALLYAYQYGVVDRLDAEPLHKRALAIYERTLGSESAYVATELNNLGGVYYEAKRYAEAEAMYLRSVAILEKALGPNDREVANPLSALADIYLIHGDYASAERLHRRAHSIRKRAFDLAFPGLSESDISRPLKGASKEARIAQFNVATSQSSLEWVRSWRRRVAPENKDAVAVIIGNSKYPAPLPDVEFADNDARAMRQYVIDVLGYRDGNIIDLRDATWAEIAAVFGNRETHEGRLYNWVRAGRSDVLVFYSGHGVPGLEDQRGYLLPVDGDPSLAEITGYPLDLLYENLAKIDARSITVFLDACFSGESAAGMLIPATSGISVTPRPTQPAPDLTVITAASGTQVASWDEEAEHGLFTESLLRALYGNADGQMFSGWTDGWVPGYGNYDGAVTLAEVERYLDREMTYEARRRYSREQNATVLGDPGTVLARYGSEGAPRRSRVSANLRGPE